MADVKWIKLMTDMFDNRKIRYLRRLPDGNNIVLIWVMLLSLAGRCNAGGMIHLTADIPYTPKMLADELDFEENTVILALQALESLGMISLDPLLITNWEEYQNEEGLERIREQTRKRVAEHRAKKKAIAERNGNCNVTSNADVTQCNAIEEEIDIEEEVELDYLTHSNECVCRPEDRQTVISAWNTLGISPVSKITAGSTRYKQLNARIKEHGVESILKAIENIRKSSFLRGQNNKGWTISFDWFVKPNNFVKVLDGNYSDGVAGNQKKGRESAVDQIARLSRMGAFDE